MCQKVFYTYACKHRDISTYCYSQDTHCIHGFKSYHTFLGDQLCHDCDEKSREMRQERSRRESCQDQPLAGDTQQQQAPEDFQSISLDSKRAIRPLETSKLANMDCSVEGQFGLTPSAVYNYYARRTM